MSQPSTPVGEREAERPDLLFPSGARFHYAAVQGVARVVPEYRTVRSARAALWPAG